MNHTTHTVGQLLGIVAACISMIRPHFRLNTRIMASTMFINALNAMNFVLIGKLGSSVYLCAVAVVQSMISIWREKRGRTVSNVELVLFSLLYLCFGFYGMFSAEGFVWAINPANLLELLPIAGAMLLMLSVFAPSPQRARLYLFFNGLLWTIYSGIAGATAALTSLVSMISNAIALYKFSKDARNT